jgi:hypothetical protein
MPLSGRCLSNATKFERAGKVNLTRSFEISGEGT